MVELFEFMIARCAPEDIKDAYVKYADYEALEAKANDWHKVADDRTKEIIRLEAKLAKFKREYPRMDLLIELENTNNRLKAALDAATKGRE